MDTARAFAQEMYSHLFGPKLAVKDLRTAKLKTAVDKLKQLIRFVHVAEREDTAKLFAEAKEVQDLADLVFHEVSESLSIVAVKVAVCAIAVMSCGEASHFVAARFLCQIDKVLDMRKERKIANLVSRVVISGAKYKIFKSNAELEVPKKCIQEHQNAVGPDGTADRVLRFSALLTLHTSYQCFQYDDDEASMLAAALDENETLTYLSLPQGTIGDDGAAKLAALLAKTSTITEVNLYHNKIGDDGASKLAAALTTSSVTDLSLSDNNIGANCAKLAAALEKQLALTKLNLGSNRLGDDGASKLAAALTKNSTLLTLYLGCDTIGDDGATQLAAALETNSTLRHLSLECNRIGDDGASMFAAALMTRNSTLWSLNLGCNKIGDAGACKLGVALETNRTLRYLFLGFNSMGSMLSYQCEYGPRTMEALREYAKKRARSLERQGARKTQRT